MIPTSIAAIMASLTLATAAFSAPAPQGAPQDPIFPGGPPTVAPGADVIDALPPLAVSPATLNMGTALPMQGMRGSAELRNVGDRPLKILAVTPSCKCTTTNNLAGTVIMPGQSVELEAELEPVPMPQIQRAELRILVEGYGQIISLPLTGEVTLPIRTNPKLINAAGNGPREGRVVIESMDQKPFTICSVGGRKPEFLGYDPATQEPRSSYLIKYNLDTWSPTFPAYLVVETDREDCPVLDIWIRHETTIPRPGMRMVDYRVNAGRVDLGSSTEVVVETREPVEEILAVESLTPDVGIDLVRQEADANGRKIFLKVTPRNPQGGLFYTQFKLYNRDKDQLLTLFGTARPAGAKGCVGCVAVDPPAPRAPSAQEGAAPTTGREAPQRPQGAGMGATPSAPPTR